jgi:acetyltransferase
MMDDDGIDSIFINFVTPFFVDNDSIARVIAEVNEKRKKPIVCNLMTDKDKFPRPAAILKEAGVPCYGFPGTAARALVALTKCGEIRRRATGEIGRFDDVDRAKAENIIEAAQEAGRKVLRPDETYGILGAYNIPSAEAEKCADTIGYPVVVKADSVSVLHKSDVGGVAINLPDRAAVRRAMEGMAGKFHASDLRFLVQGCVLGGREIIIGGKTDGEVGPLVMVGLGGIHVEVFKDVVFRLCPVTDLEAAGMVSELKAAPILSGARGEKGVDRGAIIDTIRRVSQMLLDLPMIREMDLNPLLAREDGVFVVDARMTL